MLTKEAREARASMSASFSSPLAAQSRPATAAPQQQKQRARASSTPTTFVHHRRSSSRVFAASSSSSSAPKLTNKPAWAGESALRIELEIGAEGKRNRDALFPDLDFDD